MSEDTHAMTVAELRRILADLPDEEFIFVDGYEGGYDMPRLERRRLATLEPWVKSSSYTGPWAEQPAYGPDGGVPVWVLARG